MSILEERAKTEPLELYFGGYGAFDGFALACGKEFKETHPTVKLVFITPYISPSYQRNYLHTTAVYDAIIYPELENVPPRFAISYRNKWMVEKSDLIIAYIDHDWGGAYQTYKHAKRKEKEIYNLTGKDF